MAVEARVGGLTFVGDGASGTYTLDALDGFFVGGTTMRREYTDRPTAHGQFPAPGYLSGRVVRLSGLVQTDSASAFEAALVALDGLLADGLSDTLEVETTVGTSTLEVYLFTTPQVRMLVYGQSAEYQLQLWAPDPVRGVTP